MQRLQGRRTSSIVQITLVVIFEGLLLFTLVFGQQQQMGPPGVLQLQIEGFYNPHGRDVGGRCCALPANSSAAAVACPGPCRTFFRVCAARVGPNWPEEPDLRQHTLACPLGLLVTPVIANNSLDPQRDGILLMRFPYREWPGKLKLTVEAWHDVTGTLFNQEMQHATRADDLEDGVARMILRVERRHKLVLGEDWLRRSVHTSVPKGEPARRPGRRISMTYSLRLVPPPPSTNPTTSPAPPRTTTTTTTTTARPSPPTRAPVTTTPAPPSSVTSVTSINFPTPSATPPPAQSSVPSITGNYGSPISYPVYKPPGSAKPPSTDNFDTSISGSSIVPPNYGSNVNTNKPSSGTTGSNHGSVASSPVYGSTITINIPFTSSGNTGTPQISTVTSPLYGSTTVHHKPTEPSTAGNTGSTYGSSVKFPPHGSTVNNQFTNPLTSGATGGNYGSPSTVNVPTQPPSYTGGSNYGSPANSPVYTIHAKPTEPPTYVNTGSNYGSSVSYPSHVSTASVQYTNPPSSSYPGSTYGSTVSSSSYGSTVPHSTTTTGNTGNTQSNFGSSSVSTNPLGNPGSFYGALTGSPSYVAPLTAESTTLPPQINSGSSSASPAGQTQLVAQINNVDYGNEDDAGGFYTPVYLVPKVGTGSQESVTNKSQQQSTPAITTTESSTTSETQIWNEVATVSPPVPLETTIMDNNNNERWTVIETEVPQRSTPEIPSGITETIPDFPMSTIITTTPGIPKEPLEAALAAAAAALTAQQKNSGEVHLSKVPLTENKSQERPVTEESNESQSGPVFSEDASIPSIINDILSTTVKEMAQKEINQTVVFRKQ